MPKGAISGVSDSIHPSMPNFAAAYAEQNIWPANVELDRQHVGVVAGRGRDLRMVAAGGDDRVAGGRDGPGDVETQAPARAGDEPRFLYSHRMFLNRTASDDQRFSCKSNS
jgi:hypothetical protein